MKAAYMVSLLDIVKANSATGMNYGIYVSKRDVWKVWVRPNGTRYDGVLEFDSAALRATGVRATDATVRFEFSPQATLPELRMDFETDMIDARIPFISAVSFPAERRYR